MIQFDAVIAWFSFSLHIDINNRSVLFHFIPFYFCHCLIVTQGFPVLIRHKKPTLDLENLSWNPTFPLIWPLTIFDFSGLNLSQFQN